MFVREGYKMALSYIWTVMAAVSLLFAIWTGQAAAVSAAAMDAAAEAVDLGLRLLGPIMLWSAVMELMNRSDELCRLVVLNTASLQLLPTTVAAIRASLGAGAPFDILPAVWVSSTVSICVGLLTARLFSRWS